MNINLTIYVLECLEDLIEIAKEKQRIFNHDFCDYLMAELKQHNAISVLGENYINENHQISSRASRVMEAIEKYDEKDGINLQNFQLKDGEKMFF